MKVEILWEKCDIFIRFFFKFTSKETLLKRLYELDITQAIYHTLIHILVYKRQSFIDLTSLIRGLRTFLINNYFMLLTCHILAYKSQSFIDLTSLIRRLRIFFNQQLFYAFNISVDKVFICVVKRHSTHNWTFIQLKFVNNIWSLYLQNSLNVFLLY